jgi:Carboxypeptidase regulatory-like domain/Tetratricopeptide repeat
MDRLRVAAFAVVSILVIPQFAFAQQLVSLSGTVFSESSERVVSQAAIHLCDAGGNTIQQGMTNDSGEFNFRQIRRNEYILTVDAAGYQSYSMHLDLSFTSDRGLSIYLTPNPDDPATPSPAGRVSAHEMSMPQTARDLLASGEKDLYTNKNPKEALAKFKRAVSAAPDFYEAYYQMGMAYLTMGNRDETEKSFRKSIEVSNDKFGEPVIGLASLMIDKGDLVQSEMMTRHGLELSPKAWFGYYQLGRIQFNENKIADAQKSAEQARSLAPDTALVYRLLCSVHLREKEYAAVIEDIDAYLKLDPDSPAATRAKEIRSKLQAEISKEKLPSAASAQP